MGGIQKSPRIEKMLHDCIPLQIYGGQFVHSLPLHKWHELPWRVEEGDRVRKREREREREQA